MGREKVNNKRMMEVAETDIKKLVGAIDLANMKKPKLSSSVEIHFLQLQHLISALKEKAVCICEHLDGPIT